MGHNVQSQAGVSLSSLYDVKGSQAAIERILTTEVPAVHDMAVTLFSERVSGTVRRRQTGAILQNAVFNEVLDDLPGAVSRILGVSVFVDTAARANSVSVMVRDPVAGREVPIFVWDFNNDVESNLRLQDNGGAVATLIALIPTRTFPAALSMVFGTEQPQSMPEISFRGFARGFGAGDVTFTLLLYLAFTDIARIPGYGLPVPAW